MFPGKDMRHLYWSLAEPLIFLRIFLARAFSWLNIRFVKKKKKNRKERRKTRYSEIKETYILTFCFLKYAKKRKKENGNENTEIPLTLQQKQSILS